jgi:hypothetical protein
MEKVVKTRKSVRSDTPEERSKDKIKEMVAAELTSFWTQVLNLVEVSVDGRDRYNALRAKILTLGNNAKRAIEHNLDVYYRIEFVPNKETVIEVKRLQD